MYFEFNFYSSLLLVFFVHGLVYAYLVYRKSLKNETPADRWLSLFLLLCSLYITPWMLGFAGWYDTLPYRNVLFYIPFQHLYFIGPVIFFYIQSLLNPRFHFKRRHWLHLLPGFLYLVYTLIVWLTDRVFLKEPYFLADGVDPDFALWYQLTGLFSMLLYFLLSLRYYILFRKLMVHVVSYADRVTFTWVRDFLIAFLLMLLLRVGFYVASIFIATNYWRSWWYFLLFAIIYYYIAITGYSNSVKARIPFIPNLLSNRPVLVVNHPSGYNLPEPVEEFAEIEIDPVDEKEGGDELVGQWKDRLLALMKQGKAYENPELSLASLSLLLGANAVILSKVINKGFAQNFNDFVNTFRIEAIKEKLDEGEFQTQTLVGIAYDCGFNSKATFNRAFKKITGMTPSTYLEQLKSGTP